MDFSSPHPKPRIGTAEEIATTLVYKLRDFNQTVGVAESFTGGGIMATITSVPGSSAVLHGGVVSYATSVKREVLGVEDSLIAKEGVIHPEVARQMAKGARKITSHGSITTWGIATTGVAGPASQDNKPAGTVYIGIDSSKESWTWGPFNFPGDRDEVRQATIKEALCLLHDILEDGKAGEVPHTTGHSEI
ncbi:hypothetical protein PENSTE_c003G04850 [Penicillium steckii]|uniref:CinA C-terminal domain-containing protein n=1 Tax=Penicillium steckii TaxID=303698 RepID=A0A1V6TS35_9EURO|nr:hypothetical protein PENSTE_c003G04850 [Penicillium steckii]